MREYVTEMRRTAETPEMARYVGMHPDGWLTKDRVRQGSSRNRAGNSAECRSCGSREEGATVGRIDSNSFYREKVAPGCRPYKIPCMHHAVRPRKIGSTSLIAAETDFGKQHPDGWATHLENAWALELVERGPGMVHAGGVETVVQARDALLFPPGVEQVFPGGSANRSHSQRWIVFHLHPHIDNLLSWPEVNGAGWKKLHIGEETIWQEILNAHDQLRSILFKRSPKRRLEAAFVVLELMLLWLDAGNPNAPRAADDQRMMEATLFMERHFRDPLRVADIARACNLSEDHFAHLYKATTGMTPMRRLEQIRLSRAKERLLKTNDTLEAIAFDCGFCNAYHFSNVFYQRLGIRPSNFRQNGGALTEPAAAEAS